ncbi:MAG TPA: hypothetical protein VIY86_10915 [Pirellulaceae bacterium]
MPPNMRKPRPVATHRSARQVSHQCEYDSGMMSYGGAGGFSDGGMCAGGMPGGMYGGGMSGGMYGGGMSGGMYGGGMGTPVAEMGSEGMGGVIYDNPQMPGYAWPSYASHPNYAAVSYPRQYSPMAWPYIGPFYPYPQVPLGWRKVCLEWDDGWWMLDFKSK